MEDYDKVKSQARKSGWQKLKACIASSFPWPSCKHERPHARGRPKLRIADNHGVQRDRLYLGDAHHYAGFIAYVPKHLRPRRQPLLA